MALQKNATRFGELVWPHLATILRTAQCLSRDDAAAEDLTQDTMIKAFKSLDSLRDDGCVKAWLMTILRRTHIDQASSARFRAQSLEGMNLDPAAPDEAIRTKGDAAWDEPDELLETFSDRQMIMALKGLPKEIRWALLLMDVEGLDQRETAEVLEIPVGTVKSRIYRGRAMLHTALQPAAKRDNQATRVGMTV